MKRKTRNIGTNDINKLRGLQVSVLINAGGVKVKKGKERRFI